jgi:HEAT repeat protein
MLWWRLRQLRSKRPTVRAEAAERLGESKDQRAVEPLIAALEDADPLVRTKVALALGRLGDQRAVAPLLNALESPDAPPMP